MISLSRLRTTCNVKADQDAELTRIRDECVDMFESLTGLLWKKRTGHVERFNFPNPYSYDSFQVELMGPRTITLLEHRHPSESTWTTIDATNIDDDPTGRTVRIMSGHFYEQVRVTYDAGYDETNCPSDIMRALLAQAAFILARNAPDKLVVTSQAIQGGNTSFMKADYHPTFSEIARQRARKS